MAWGSKNQIENAAAVGGTELFSDAVSLTPGESCHVQVVANSSGTDDSLFIHLYATLDASTENWDTVPVWSQLLDCTDGADNDVSFVVEGLYRFRLGFERSGSTDTITVNAWERQNSIDV